MLNPIDTVMYRVQSNDDPRMHPCSDRTIYKTVGSIYTQELWRRRLQGRRRSSLISY